MKKGFILFGIILIFLSGCGGVDTSNTFYFTVDSAIESLDYANASYKQTFELFTDIYATLMEVDQDGNLANGLAKDIQVSEDGLTYTITLRDDAVWVDNTGQEVGKVTANDFVFSWQRMVDPATAAGYSFIFEPIKNATEISAGTVEKSELGVQALDDYTLEVTLVSPTPYFESMLAFPTFGGISEEAYNKYGGDYGTSSETTWYNGPYYITDYSPDSEVIITKNPLYYDVDIVSLDSIVYKVIEDTSSRYNGFKTGELNYAAITNQTDIDEAKSNDTLNVELTGYSYYAILNQEEGKVTSNENLRKALAYGFDREGIEESAYGGNNTPIEYLIPEGITEVAYNGVEYRDYADESLITYDKEKADEYFDAYMKDMGYTDRKDIEIEYIASEGEANEKLAEVIQAHYLQNFGITINITTLPFKEFVEVRGSGDFDMLIQGWGPDFADPSTYLALFQTSAIGSQNYANYSNEEYDTLYLEAILETDVDKRMEDFAELEKMIIDDNIIIPFYQKNDNLVITDDYNVPSHLFLHISHKYTTKEIE